MKYRPLAVGLVVSTLAASTLTASGQDQVEQPDSARSVTFTSGQVSAGKSVYDRICAACHGGSLEGSNDAPALSGDFFMGYWGGRSVSDLYTYMRDFMPPGAPSSLQDSQYADIVAYVLSRNGFEPGEISLNPEDDLESMAISQE